MIDSFIIVVIIHNFFIACIIVVKIGIPGSLNMVNTITIVMTMIDTSTVSLPVIIV
jgi:hypothetical protein